MARQKNRGYQQILTPAYTARAGKWEAISGSLVRVYRKSTGGLTIATERKTSATYILQPSISMLYKNNFIHLLLCFQYTKHYRYNMQKRSRFSPSSSPQLFLIYYFSDGINRKIAIISKFFQRCSLLIC